MSSIPDGVYRNEIKVEAFDEPVTLACAIKVRGDRLTIDFDGTGPVLPAAINVPLCYTRAVATYAIKAMVLPNIPNNEGSVTPIEVIAPKGCILDALPPAATGARLLVGHFVMPLIFGALATALPDLVQGDPGMMSVCNFVGKDRQGRDFTTLFFSAGGFGALKGLDGTAATPGPVQHDGDADGNLGDDDRASYHFAIASRRLGRSWQFRGGLGQRIVLANETGNPATVFTMGTRTEFPAQGVCGGLAGALRKYFINGKEIHPKGCYEMAPGDVLELLEAGGGGYGDVMKRDRLSIESDINHGFLTRAAAERDYFYRLCKQSTDWWSEAWLLFGAKRIFVFSARRNCSLGKVLRQQWSAMRRIAVSACPPISNHLSEDCASMGRLAQCKLPSEIIALCTPLSRCCGRARCWQSTPVDMSIQRYGERS